MIVVADGAVSVISVPAWLDIATILVGALGGALFAHRRALTMTGALLIAISAGLGGGLIRDVLLDVGPPRAITDPNYLVSAALGALCGLLFARWSRRIASVMLAVDSLALGMFAVVGVERTLAADYPAPSAVLVGVTAASAGGIIRDLLAGDAPAIARAGPWDASAALVGCTVMVTLVAGLGLPTSVVEWPVIAGIMAIAVLSARLGWSAPMADDLQPLIDKPVAAVRRVARGVPRAANLEAATPHASRRARSRLARHRSRRDPVGEREDYPNL